MWRWRSAKPETVPFGLVPLNGLPVAPGVGSATCELAAGACSPATTRLETTRASTLVLILSQQRFTPQADHSDWVQGQLFLLFLFDLPVVRRRRAVDVAGGVLGPDLE